MSLQVKILVWLFYFGSGFAAPTDEFGEIVNQGEVSFLDDKLMRIIPSGHTLERSQKNYERFLPFPEISDMDNIYLKKLKDYVENGFALKGLIFNVYDDNMRGASIALFRLMLSVNSDDLQSITAWAKEHVNNDIWIYALRLKNLYDGKEKHHGLLPPFISKPNYFVNSETIIKALKLKSYRSFEDIHPHEAKIYQIFQSGDALIINTNYSGWSLPQNGGDEEINYFREDVSLNSYYYGVHLMHPFWMSNDELDEVDPKHAERYYYIHQQLMARYLLEKEHYKYKETPKVIRDTFDIDPNLVYESGMPFPIIVNSTRYSVYRNKLVAIDIAIKECISRGLLVMNNGTIIKMSNDIGLLAKLIRANLDSVKIAKVIRSLVGGYPVDKYNPNPSVFHHPETSLRAEKYWKMIQHVLKYFKEYIKSLEPTNLLEYETDEFEIVDSNFTTMTTYFDYFQFSINNAWNVQKSQLKWPKTIAARLKRLNHSPFIFNFTVVSKNDADVVVRLYLGPQDIDTQNFAVYGKFYELDTFMFNLEAGSNVISWLPETSSKYSFDNYYNFDQQHTSQENRFDIFKFPGHLLLPKGTEEGLNLTLFVMITLADEESLQDFSHDNIYKQLCRVEDRKPIGFPFHRDTIGFNRFAPNYKLYNITIYHSRGSNDGTGYFSPNLY